MKNEWAKTWAAIDPALADHDLRPYVFVTRDKRSSLGGLVAASHLEDLIDRLMGPTLMVRRASDQVGKLTGPEPDEVFEAIRGRVLQEDSFTSKPKGIDGLVKVVELHPALQRRLLDFLRELPLPKIGAWAVSSWGTCFPDAAMSAEFQTLVRGWAEQTDNATLQATAKAVSQFRRN